jgi:maltose alpha-D-glucosyltransferase/alpha-amylase
MSAAPPSSELDFPCELLAPARREWLAARLFDYARARRWYRAKTRGVSGFEIADLIAVERRTKVSGVIALLAIAYEEGDRHLYVVPLARVDRETAERLRAERSHALVAALDGPLGDGELVDGLATGQAAPALLDLVAGERSFRGETGELRGRRTASFHEVAGGETLAPTVHGAEQTNTTISFGERVLLKIYRQLTPGENPELEVGRFLTEHGRPARVPSVLGDIEYRDARDARYGLGIAHEFVPNGGDAWTFALREVRAFFDAARGQPANPERDGWDALLSRALALNSVPPPAPGAFVTSAETLGRRTGQLHLALASDPRDPAFAPESLAREDRAALAARATAMLAQNLEAVSAMRDRFPAESRRLADWLLGAEARQAIAARIARFRNGTGVVMKTRTHGDLHLGQVLVRNDDFVIIDFEGEPARPLSERRAKSSPLRDVMGMARSFDYAPEAVLREPAFRPASPDREAWAHKWTRDVTAAYLRGYLHTVGDAPFIPQRRDELVELLTFYQLEKVIYEVGYEANHRPDWVEIPLRGLHAILSPESTQ